MFATIVGAALLTACGSNEPSTDGGSDGAADATTSDAATEIDARAADSGIAATGDAGATDVADAGDTLDASTSPAFPIADPPLGYSGLAVKGAMVLVAETGKTISGISITNPDGPCIIVRGGADVVIEHVALGPCKGNGVQIEGNAARITLRDSYVHDTVDNGVESQKATDLRIAGNWFARNRSGGYFVDSSGVRFERNSVLNVQGGMARGQLAQFNRVSGANNAIRCNLAENRPGESMPEDAINLFETHGTAASPILVEGNRVKGGGPSTSGGGVLLGDGGGTYQVSRWNILVDPGQYGTAVAGGSHMTLEKNVVYARRQPFTNVGIYVWDQYASSCTDVTVKDNQVDWTNSKDEKNPYWNAGNCSAVAESGSDFSATLSPAILERVPDPCK